MNRFIFGRGWVFCDETNGGDGNGDAGGAAGGTGDAGGGTGDDADPDAGAVDDGAAGAKTDDKGGDKGAAAGEPKDMLDAITKGLEKTSAKKVDEEDPAAKEAAAAAARAAEVLAAGKHANGTPKKNEKGEDLDDTGKVVPKAAPKPKTAAELDLKPEEKKLLGAKAQARFGEVITTLKARETTIAQMTEQMKPLQEARDAVLGIMQETGTTSNQLAAYLEFNRLLQSTEPKDLESALEMVENQRAALYTALGREPEGGDLDLLKEFPDLAEDVAEARMTRERALELAQARRDKAAATAREQQAGQRQQNAVQAKAAADNALKSIETWTVDLAKKDIDYKAKEERLLEQVDQVIQTYPPNQWLSTLKLLYAGIQITKAAPAGGKVQQPLRPSGAKPGAKAPQNMFEAMWGADKAG